MGLFRRVRSGAPRVFDFFVPYLSYVTSPYLITNGSHLQKAASTDFTRKLADDLKMLSAAKQVSNPIIKFR